MSSIGALRAGAGRLWARFVRVFFANFFRVLLLAVSLSEWGVIWWVFPETINALPAAIRFGAPFALFAGNRALARRTQRRQRRRHALPRLYYAFAFTCLFCMLYLILAGAVWGGARIFLDALTVEARTARADLMVSSELDTAFRWLVNSGMAVVGLAFAYGYTIGQLRLKVRRLRLPLRDWSASLHGMRIVQISDIHIGQNLDLQQLSRFVSRVNDLEPDLVCITGDIADSPSADLRAFLPVLAGLRSRRGVVAILGNHDHYAGADEVERALREATPFTVLRDQQTVLDVDGEPLHIIGLDDRGRDWARGVQAVAYLVRAVEAVPAGEPMLLLSHRPDVFPQAASNGVALTLSGHTHGGQIGLPWLNGRIRNLAEFITAFDRGLYESEGCYLYVNCGLGVTGQRIRLNTPREITVIEAESLSGVRRAA